MGWYGGSEVRERLSRCQRVRQRYQAPSEKRERRGEEG